MHIKIFTFNPFSENTYVLYDDSGECAIVDPGCIDSIEEESLTEFINSKKLKPVLLLNTHCHIDHILGNKFVSRKWQLPLHAHRLELDNLIWAEQSASRWGLRPANSPKPEVWLEEGTPIIFGHTELEVLFTPGHSPGHVVFYNARENILIGGDVLFRQSIGRTDLPGGNMDVLLASIREKLFTLNDDVRVYPGHGPGTTIGYEKVNNMFVGEMAGQ